MERGRVLKIKWTTRRVGGVTVLEVSCSDVKGEVTKEKTVLADQNKCS